MTKYSELLSKSSDYRTDLYGLLKQDFEFLESEIGLVRSDLSDGLKYSNERTTVIVRLWEEPWVGVDRTVAPLENPDFGIPIWAVMNVRKSAYLYNDADKAIDKFPIWARALRECCLDLLRGDWSEIEEVTDWLRCRAENQQVWEDRLMK